MVCFAFWNWRDGEHCRANSSSRISPRGSEKVMEEKVCPGLKRNAPRPSIFQGPSISLGLGLLISKTGQLVWFQLSNTYKAPSSVWLRLKGSLNCFGRHFRQNQSPDSCTLVASEQGNQWVGESLFVHSLVVCLASALLLFLTQFIK